MLILIKSIILIIQKYEKMLIVKLVKGKKMLNSIKFLVFILFSLNSAVLMAHPGHGNHSGHSLLHYLTSPMHILPIMLVVGVGIFVIMQKHMKKMEKSKID